MIVFRHTDPRFPFLWESADQPGGRWNEAGEGPVNTFADTPEGAWAELLRHERKQVQQLQGEVSEVAAWLDQREHDAHTRRLYGEKDSSTPPSFH